MLLGKEFSLGSQVAFRCHVFLVSLTLEQFLSLACFCDLYTSEDGNITEGRL